MSNAASSLGCLRERRWNGNICTLNFLSGHLGGLTGTHGNEARADCRLSQEGAVFRLGNGRWMRWYWWGLGVLSTDVAMVPTVLRGRGHRIRQTSHTRVVGRTDPLSLVTRGCGLVIPIHRSFLAFNSAKMEIIHRQSAAKAVPAETTDLACLQCRKLTQH